MVRSTINLKALKGFTVEVGMDGLILMEECDIKNGIGSVVLITSATDSKGRGTLSCKNNNFRYHNPGPRENDMDCLMGGFYAREDFEDKSSLAKKLKSSNTITEIPSECDCASCQFKREFGYGLDY